MTEREANHIGLRLDSLAATGGMVSRPAILDAEPEPGGESSFSLYDIDVPDGYVGALAVERTGHRIRYFDEKGHEIRGHGEVESEMRRNL